MTAKPVWVDGHRRLLDLTELNRATSAAYRACGGKHVSSGEGVERIFPGGPRILPVCRNCGVPYNAPKVRSWSSV
jgi:hypothetical protein